MTTGRFPGGSLGSVANGSPFEVSSRPSLSDRVRDRSPGSAGWIAVAAMRSFLVAAVEPPAEISRKSVNATVEALVPDELDNLVENGAGEGLGRAVRLQCTDAGLSVLGVVESAVELCG